MRQHFLGFSSFKKYTGHGRTWEEKTQHLAQVSWMLGHQFWRISKVENSNSFIFLKLSASSNINETGRVSNKGSECLSGRDKISLEWQMESWFQGAGKEIGAFTPWSYTAQTAAMLWKGLCNVKQVLWGPPAKLFQLNKCAHSTISASRCLCYIPSDHYLGHQTVLLHYSTVLLRERIDNIKTTPLLLWTGSRRLESISITEMCCVPNQILLEADN